MQYKCNWVIHAETESEAARTGRGINRLCFKTFSTVRKKNIARQPRLLCSIKLDTAYLPALRESAFQRSPFRTDVEQPNLPLFSLALTPPLRAAQRWTPVHSKYWISESALWQKHCKSVSVRFSLQSEN